MKFYVNGHTYIVGFAHPVISEFHQRPCDHALLGALQCAELLISGHLDPKSVVGQKTIEKISEVQDALMDSLCEFSRKSVCFIRSEQGELVASDESFCNKKDRFERSIGRLTAFLKTVAKLPVSERDGFYQAFHRTNMSLPDEAVMLELNTTRDGADKKLAPAIRSFYERRLVRQSGHAA